MARLTPPSAPDRARAVAAVANIRRLRRENRCSVPKARSRSGFPEPFRSSLVPPYVRRSASLDAAIPWLYLRGSRAASAASPRSSRESTSGRHRGRRGQQGRRMIKPPYTTVTMAPPLRAICAAGSVLKNNSQASSASGLRRHRPPLARPVCRDLPKLGPNEAARLRSRNDRTAMRPPHRAH